MPDLDIQPVTPCPICTAPYGFHDDGPHVEASNRIPAELRRPSNTELRALDREARHRAFLKWKGR